jgi:hypothetical protein
MRSPLPLEIPPAARGAATLAALAACAVPAVLVHLRCAVLPEDDAFINFRYVDNALAGAGLVYNEGERVFGSSTPMFVAWLALLRSMARDVPADVLAVRMNVVPLLAAAAALWVLVRRSSPHPLLAFAATGGFLLQLPVLYVSISGMETTLFLAFVLGSLAASASCRPETGAALAACATLARPEGAFCLAGAALAADRRRLVRVVLAYALPLAVWVVPAWIHYGTPIPHSILAKAKPLYPLDRGDALRLMTGQISDWITHGRGPAAVAVAAPGAISAAVAVGLAVAVRRRARPALIAASFGAVLLPFYALANPLLMSWYWPAIQVGALLLLLSGLGTLAGLHETRPSRSALRRAARRALPLALALWLGAATFDDWRQFRRAVLEQGLDPYSFGRDRSAEVVRIRAYEEAARWLNGRPTRPRVAAPEIGAFGYSYRGRILDVCGLVSPEAMRYLPVPLAQRHNATVGAISAELVRDLRPEVIVTLRAFAERSLFADPGFRASYAEIHRVPLPQPVWFGSDAVHVFERVAAR